MYPDLRRESAERLVELDLPGYALGGLSVGEPRALTMEIIEATLPLLPQDRPRYVMGVGYPEEIVEYAALGVDMMDCVLPTRAARHGLIFTSQGRINIKGQRYAEDQEPLDPECGCMVCRRYTRAYLRHLAAAREPLSAILNTLHNLAYYLDTMRSVRDAILMGSLPEAYPPTAPAPTIAIFRPMLSSRHFRSPRLARRSATSQRLNHVAPDARRCSSAIPVRPSISTNSCTAQIRRGDRRPDRTHSRSGGATVHRRRIQPIP